MAAANVTHLLREAAMASAAALRARRELLAVLGDLNSSQRAALDGSIILLARIDDPRSVGEAEADILLARLAAFK